MTTCLIQPTVSQGDSKPVGLNIGGLITQVTLNSVTWTALPPTPLDERNAVAIQNQSAVNIKINYDPAVVGYVGMEVLSPTGERFYNIANPIQLYGKCAAGTCVVLVEEIA